MFEDSPRASKRRKVVESGVGSQQSPQSNRTTPRSGHKRPRAADAAENQSGAGVVQDSSAQKELQELPEGAETPATSILADQLPTSGRADGIDADSIRTNVAVAAADSSLRGAATSLLGPDRNPGEVDGMDIDENHEAKADPGQKPDQDALEPAQSNLRSSARTRKSTWKLAEPVPEKSTPTRQKRTPNARKQPQNKQVVDVLSPVIKETSVDELVTSPADMATAALNAVSDITTTPTPTPKRGARSRKTQKTVSVLNLGDQTAGDGVQATNGAVTPTPKRRGRPPKKKDAPTIPKVNVQLAPEATDAFDTIAAHTASSTQDELALEPSPFKTTAPDLTPTPRKRGRPPKARVVDEFGFSAVDPLAPPSKRQRTSLAQEAEDIDPLAAFTRRDPAAIAARKGPKEKATPAKVKAVTWKDYKDIDPADQPKPDIQDSMNKLEVLLSDETYHELLSELKTGILQVLTGRRRMPLQGLDEEYQKVRQLVEQTVVAGEGNSMFLIGPRGSGKSALIETVLSEMSTEHSGQYHVIRLNGFIHTDDKLALREIWRQLGREMELEDSMLERSNYADTLTSLLAVLSHPAEQELGREGGKPDEAAGQQTAKSVVFVIDEFDLFTSHARQTLLYNLFDIAQARKAPIAVLGLTTRVDVTESLEKRVKSRFSHRSVFLPRPKSFPAFQQIILAALTSSNHSAAAPITASPDEESQAHAYRTLHSAWTSYITSLFAPSTSLTSTLRTIYATSRSIPTALTALLIPLASLTPTTIPHDSSFTPAQPQPRLLLAPDSKLHLLRSLNTLELALLIATARLDIILNVDTCNFNMAYDEYSTLAERTKARTAAAGVMALGAGAGGGRVWSRDAALGAWERLEGLELIMPLATAGYGASAGLADVGRSGKLVRCDVSLEEIRYSGVEMSGVMMKWCKEI